MIDEDEDDIVPATRKPAAVEDEDDGVVPALKKVPAAEDEDDEPRPVKRKAVADEDAEEVEEAEEAPKQAKRRTPWYVLLPLLILSLGGGAGLAGLWTIGFTYLDLDRGLRWITDYDHKILVGVISAAVVTVLCLLFSMIPVRGWLRFLLVFLILGLGYGGSFAAIHWWKELPIPEDPQPPPSDMPPGGPMGGMQAPGGRGGPMMPPGGRGGPPMGPPQGGQPEGPPQ